jgi:integrase
MTFRSELNRLDALRDDLSATDPYWSPDAKGFKTAMNNCRNVFKPVRAETPATSLTTGHYDMLLDWCDNRGHSNNTKNRHIAVLSKLDGQAVFRGLKAYKVPVKYLPVTPKQVIPYLEWEITGMRSHSAAAKDYDWHDCFVVSALLGCRQGELLKLRMSNLSFDAQPLLRFVDTKTSDTRVLPMVGEVHDILHRRYHDRTDEEQLVFPVNKDSLLRRLRRYQKLVGVKDWRYKNWHTLRHNAVSKMWKKNIDLKTIMATVGHKNSATTLRVYSHTQLDEKARALAALAA